MRTVQCKLLDQGCVGLGKMPVPCVEGLLKPDCVLGWVWLWEHWAGMDQVLSQWF